MRNPPRGRCCGKILSGGMLCYTNCFCTFLHCLTPCFSFATMTCAPSAYGKWNPAPCPNSHLNATWRLSWLLLSNPPCLLLVALDSHRMYPAPYCPGSHLASTWRPLWLLISTHPHCVHRLYPALFCPGSHLNATWRPSWLLLLTHPHCLLLITLVGHPCFRFFLWPPRLLKCPTKYCSMPLLHLHHAPPADRLVV